MQGPVKVVARIGAGIAAAVLVTGCTSIVNHKGYLADEVVLRSVQPGVDNRTSVERTLGQPSFISQFGDPVWYYVSSTTSQKPFTTPKITDQSVLAVHFDAAGNVIAADRTGLDLVAYISPDDDETPTLGRERGFLQDLFGNIGQVGTGGAAANTGGGG